MSDIPEALLDSKKTFEKIADILYLQAPISNGTIFFIAILFLFVFANYSDSVLHFVWSSAMIIAAMYRLFLWYQRKNTPDKQTVYYWINHYIFASVIVGFVWGSVFFLPYVNHDIVLYGILLMVFFGVTASAISILSISLSAFFGYTLPIMGCFFIAIYSLNNPAYFYLIIAAIAYYLMLSLFARNNNKQILHSISLQFENEALIKQLQQEVTQRESLIKARTKQLEQSHQQLLDSESRLQNVIIGAELGYWDWNYQAGDYEVNNRWLEILGLSRDDIHNNISDWDSRIHPEDKQRIIAIIEDAIKNHKPFVADFRMKHKGGNWLWIQGAGSLIESDSSTHEPVRLCGTHQDISCRKNMEKELEYIAKHDYLTGLYNRIELERNFEKELSRTRRYQRSLSVFMIDIDHFKQVNDTYGHLIGDQILKKYADFLQEIIRTTDFVARYGGEEFVVILPETSLKEAEELAERLRIKTSELNIVFKERTFNITISLGIATYPEHGQSYDAIIECADSAMYRAKQGGRNCVCTAQ